MKLTLNGTVYQCPSMRLYELSLGEAVELKRLTGLTIADWRLGLLTFDRHDPDVLIGVVWLLKTRAGEPLHLDQVNMIPTSELLAGFDWSDDLAEMQASLQRLLERRGEQPDEPVAP